MPTYNYLAKKNLNETVEGTIFADSEENAIDRLIEMGLSPIKVECMAPAEPPRGPMPGPALFSRRGLTQRDLGVFTSQLKSLVRARVDLLKSLSILYNQSDKEKLKALLSDIHTAIKNGATLSDALAGHRGFFSPLYLNLIKSGEASGRLDEVLEELDGFLSKEEEFRMHVRTALAYPVLMIAVGVCVIFVLFSYVIPKLRSIFADFDYELPYATRLMLGVSDFFRHWWWAMILAVIFLGAILAQMSRSPAGRLKLGWLRLRIPVAGAISAKQSLARFCRTLSLLIRSGLPVFQALEVAIPTLENALFVRELEVVRKGVMEGASLAASMRKTSFFPAFLIQMVSVGEEGGRLEGVLAEVAAVYTQETDAKLKIVTALLEPAIILVLGLVLGGVVLAMLLPIFQINTLIQ